MGETALMFASIWGDVEISKLLIEAGADLNIQYLGELIYSYVAEDEWYDEWANEFNHYTVLMIASEMGYTKIVELLINAEAETNLQDDVGRTALMIAIEEGHNEIIQLLNEVRNKE